MIRNGQYYMDLIIEEVRTAGTCSAGLTDAIPPMHTQ
jgi:hypothetical protein